MVSRVQQEKQNRIITEVLLDRVAFDLAWWWEKVEEPKQGRLLSPVLGLRMESLQISQRQPDRKLGVTGSKNRLRTGRDKVEFTNSCSLQRQTRSEHVSHYSKL